jgi:hypothetical protein
MRRRQRAKVTLVAVALLCFLATEASANHLHYYGVDDPLYTPNIASVVADPSIPLFLWVIIGGSTSSQVTIRNGTTVQIDIDPNSAVSPPVLAFDAPLYEGDTDKDTAFFEFEVSQLTSTPSASGEFGFTDLQDDVRFDDRNHRLVGDRNSFITSGLPPLNSLGTFPYRVQIYYQFHDFVMTAVVIDEALGRSATMSWQANVQNPFQNFFGLGADGTDPDHLDIYPYFTTQVSSTITALAWDVRHCDVVDGAVDIDRCGQTTADLPAILAELAQCQADGLLCNENFLECNANFAACQTDLGQANVALAACLADPRDADADGETDVTDLCPATPAGVAVDSDGCSHEQFCARVVATALYGRRECRRSDWRNDEPRLRNPRDCVVDLGARGHADDVCVAATE